MNTSNSWSSDIPTLKTKISKLERLLKEAYPSVKAAASYLSEDDLVPRARLINDLAMRIRKELNLDY